MKFSDTITADEFRKVRKLKKLTQKELALILGVSVVSVKSWENKRRKIPGSINNFIRLAIINSDCEKLLKLAALLKNV